MATNLLPLPPFDGVALGSAVNCRPEIYNRLLHGFLLKITGTGSPVFSEYIEYVTLSQNDKQKILIKPLIQAMADALDNANGDTLDPLFLYLPLTRPGMLFSPWGTADIDRLSITAKIVGANPAGKTLTKLEGWVCYTPVAVPQPRGDAFLQSVITTPVPVAGWNTLAIVSAAMWIQNTLTRIEHAQQDLITRAEVVHWRNEFADLNKNLNTPHLEKK